MCKRGYTEIVGMLLAHGADVNGINGHRTPLEAACYSNHQECALLCLTYGAAVDQVSIDYANSDRKGSICDHLRVIIESDVRLYVTPESHPRRGRLNDVVPLIASFIV